MKTTCLFIVGPPGVGKTFLTRRLIGMNRNGFLPDSARLVEKPKWTLIGKDVAAVGHYTGHTFDGSDTVPYNGVKSCLEYWENNIMGEFRFTIFDGDRFSHESVLGFLETRCAVGVVHLVSSDELLDKRRSERGSNQNPSWMKGRSTKASNFYKLAAARGNRVLSINAATEIEDLIDRIRSFSNF